MSATVIDAVQLAGRVRARLLTIILARALLLGGAVALVLGAIAHQAAIGVAGGVLVAAFMVWRSRAARLLERAALWVEERDTALQYEFVTAVDPRYPGRSTPMYAGPLLRRAAWKALWPAVLVFAIAVPSSALLSKIHVNGHGSHGPHAAAPIVPLDRLHPLRVDVVPPAYARLATQHLKNPSLVSSLVGSTVTFSGPGDPQGLTALRGDTDIALHATSDQRWQVTMTMPTAPSSIKITDGLQEDFVVLNPLPDLPPSADLVLPTHDTVYRHMPSEIPLEADVDDDYGLSEAHFEVLITASAEGSEDAMKATEHDISATSFHGALSGKIAGTLSLAALGIQPGYVISISAVAHDENTVSGPEPGKPQMGRSETRTIRIASGQDTDSVSVNPAPPLAIDSTYMTQRMIVMSTELLLHNDGCNPTGRSSRFRTDNVSGDPTWACIDNPKHPRKTLPRDTLEQHAAVLASKEERLQSRVYELLHGDNGGGGGNEGEAMSDIERSLFDTAYDALGDAIMSLRVAEVTEALPREYVVLYALDSIRQIQKRYYFRGGIKIDPVDVAKMRLQGPEKPDAGTRPPQPAEDTLRTRVALALTSLLRGGDLARRPSVADSLNLLQVATLKYDPQLAGALGEAATALRAKQDPTVALAKARKRLTGRVYADTANTAWAGQ